MNVQEIKDQIALLEEREQQLLSEDKIDTDALNAVRNRKAELQYELEQQEERVQKQEAVIADTVDSFQLPQDYDLRTGIEGMNEEVRGLITQGMKYMTELHNAEIQEIRTEYQEKLKDATAAVDAEAALKSNLQAQVDNFQSIVDDFIKKGAQLTQEIKDAESKRDAAVLAKEEAEAEAEKLKRENESLKKQVDELERAATAQKKPIVTGGLTFTSTLPDLTDEEKEARKKRLELERINRNLKEKYGDLSIPLLPVLNVPSLPAQEPEVTDRQLDDAFQGVQTSPDVVRGDTGGEGVPQAHEAVAEAADAQTGLTLKGITHEQLVELVKDHEKRLKALEERGQVTVADVA